MKHSFPARILAVAASTAMTAVALAAGPGQAAQTPESSPGIEYVALGSSYAAGANVGPADPLDIGQRCGRTLSAYPRLVTDALSLELTNATCGGATIDNIVSTPQQLRSTAPVGLQIDAVTADTGLVSITVGGNDVSYVRNLLAEACLGDLAANPSSPLGNRLKQYGVCTPTPDATVLANLDAIEAELIAMIEAVQAKAPHAQIVLVDYPTVLPENGKPCAAVPIPQDRQKFLLRVARELSIATKQAAQATGSGFVAASKESRHHDVCSDEPWMTGYDFSPGVSAMHPTMEGHAAVAQALIAYIK